jgi:hypothetical protein
MTFFRLGRSGKSFILEIVIVVAGVLIALVLQEMATNLRDRQRVSAMRASMSGEIADFAEILSLRKRSRLCIGAKLDALEGLLARRGSIGPRQNVGRPSYFFSSQGAWNSASSDLLSTHVSPEIFRTYGEIYEAVERYASLAEREQAHWITLQSLERQDEPIAGERRWRLLEAVAGARNEALIMNAIAEQMTTLAGRLDIKPNGALAELNVGALPICRKLERRPGPAAT